MKNRKTLWKSMLGVLVIFSVIAGTVLAADVSIDTFTDGGFNLSRSTVGQSTNLISGLSSAIGNHRMMILDVTVASSGQFSQWGVNDTSGFVSLSIPSGDQGRARLQWDGDDSSPNIDCTTGLGGADLVDSASGSPNTGIVVRVVASDSVAKSLILRVYTDCDNWGMVTHPIPAIADNTVVDLAFPFSSLWPWGWVDGLGECQRH